MQYATNKIPVGQIKIPVAKTMETGTIIVHGLNKFASLFSGALTLKVGDGSKRSSGTKKSGFAEGNDWYVMQ